MIPPGAFEGEHLVTLSSFDAVPTLLGSDGMLQRRAEQSAHTLSDAHESGTMIPMGPILNLLPDSLRFTRGLWPIISLRYNMSDFKKSAAKNRTLVVHSLNANGSWSPVLHVDSFLHSQPGFVRAPISHLSSYVVMSVYDSTAKHSSVTVPVESSKWALSSLEVVILASGIGAFVICAVGIFIQIYWRRKAQKDVRKESTTPGRFTGVDNVSQNMSPMMATGATRSVTIAANSGTIAGNSADQQNVLQNSHLRTDLVLVDPRNGTVVPVPDALGPSSILVPEEPSTTFCFSSDLEVSVQPSMADMVVEMSASRAEAGQ